MPIPEKDIKKLWGLAAGRCCKPGCEEECIMFLPDGETLVIGEMAHVIAKQSAGPRGIPDGGEDNYENLILLCPTHHTEIDKAPPGVYSAETILQWKQAHENTVRNSFLSPRFKNLAGLAIETKRLLLENRSVWEQYGPESKEAKRNPLSNLAQVWELRKLATLVPNNRRIVRMITHNKDLFDIGDFEACTRFIEHAEGFERNCYVRSEGVPRFPKEFAEVIDRYAGIQ